MRQILALMKAVIIIFVILLAMVFVFLFGWLPIYWQRVQITVWVTHYLCRVLLPFANVKVHAPPREEAMKVAGLLFANHCSYFDILAMSHVLPLRYLAKAEIVWWPLVGYFAKRIGCVFVERGKKLSRTAAREQLKKLDHFPPMVVYPEGRRNDGYTLLPFRYGAFEIAVSGQIPFTPVVVLYERQDIFASPRGENLLVAIWRVLMSWEPLHVRVMFLETVVPAAEAEPLTLAKETRMAILDILSTQGTYKNEGETAAVVNTPSQRTRKLAT